MAPSSNTHVLAIDDDPSIRQMIADYLGDNDIRVTTLGSGREIADVMSRETIDLLILAPGPVLLYSDTRKQGAGTAVVSAATCR